MALLKIVASANFRKGKPEPMLSGSESVGQINRGEWADARDLRYSGNAGDFEDTSPKRGVWGWA